MNTSILSSVAIRDRDLSRHPVADRLSWLWLLIAMLVFTIGALVSSRKW